MLFVSNAFLSRTRALSLSLSLSLTRARANTHAHKIVNLGMEHRAAAARGADAARGIAYGAADRRAGMQSWAYREVNAHL
jgi:hypothetical protein